MPAVALVGAYASISAGIAAGAATFLGGLQIAAGVMTGLGAITGNKKLMTIGAIASLGAGAYSALSGGTSAAAASATNIGDTVAPLGAAGDAAASFDPYTASLDVGGGAAAGAVAQPASFAGTELPLAGDMPDYIGGGAPAAKPQGLVQEALSQPSGAPAAPVTNATRSGTGSVQLGLVERALPEQGASFLDNMLARLDAGAGYLKKNPEVSKLGLGLVSGAADAYNQQQQLAARERLMNEQRGRYNASILNQRT